MYTLINTAGVAPELALIVAIGLAVLIGLANGILVAKVGITSFLVTLGMALFIRGLGALHVGGLPAEAPSGRVAPGTLFAGSIQIGSFTSMPGLIWFAILAVAMWFLLDRARQGNWITATGGNERAAIARGVNTANLKIGLFVLSALLAGLAGPRSARGGSTPRTPISGTGYELEVIAMCVVGGTSLYGGAGHDHRHGHRGHPAALDPQRHHRHRRARPRLQHVRRAHHPRRVVLQALAERRGGARGAS